MTTIKIVALCFSCIAFVLSTASMIIATKEYKKSKRRLKEIEKNFKNNG